MYQAHYGLREKPFSLIPDPAFLYLSRGHTSALRLLEYALSDQTGFVVLTGEVGSGKTTLIRGLLKSAAADLRVGLITNAHPSLSHLMSWILRAFDLSSAATDPVEQYHLFVDFVIQQYAEGRRTVLIIDEAQNLPPQALEEVRMLSNLNADKHFVLQLILVGQPELKETLKRPDLRQFAQRISVLFDLTPLNLQDTIGYIRHRLSVAGGAPEIIDREACTVVHHYAFGIPRLINILCDLALVHGFADDLRTINADVVLDAVDARAAMGLAVFREDAEPLSRDDRKRLILRAAFGDRPTARIVGGGE